MPLHYKLWDICCQWTYIHLSKYVHWQSYPLWLFTHQSQIQFFWGFHSWIEYMAHPILWNFAEEKKSVFGVAFGGILFCIPTGFTWIWILPNGSEFFLAKLVVVTLSHLILNMNSLESLCKIIPQNISMIY